MEYKAAVDRVLEIDSEINALQTKKGKCLADVQEINKVLKRLEDEYYMLYCQIVETQKLEVNNQVGRCVFKVTENGIILEIQPDTEEK